MLDHILRTERATLNYRLLAVVVVALGLYFQRTTVALAPTVMLLAAYLAYNLLLGRLLLPRARTTHVVYVMALVDTVALSSGLLLAGGPSGPLFFLFPLFIVYYSMFLGYRSALFSAVTFSLAYAGLHLVASRTRGIDPIIAVQIPFLFLVAILAGYLSARRLEERREKEDLQEFIRVQSHAQSLAETAKALSKTWELPPFLQQVALRLSSMLGLPYCLVALWDKEQRAFASVTAVPEVEKLGKRDWDGAVTKGDPGSVTLGVLQSGLPALLDALPVDGPDISGYPSWAREVGAGPLVVIPLRVLGQQVGVAYVFDVGQKHSLTEKEIGLAQSYAELAAEAISKIQSYGKAQARIQQLAGDLDSAVERLDRVKDSHRRPLLTVGELRLDGAKEQAYVGDSPLNLSPTEFELLYVLAENAGQPVNQETLLRRVWGDSYQGQGNVVDVSVHRLRRKLEGNTGVQRIVTIRGRGYMLLESPPAAHPPKVSPAGPRR